MPWLQLKLEVDQGRAEAAAAALEECGAVSVSLEDAGSELLFEHWPEETPLWARTRVVGLFPEGADPGDLQARIGGLLVGGTPTTTSEWLPDADWERSWLAQFKPLHFGAGLWVCPSWCTPPVPDATTVILDPGLAFGTGTHASTALCLEWLARQDLADRDIIDYGCGSGVLAIAALKRGARTATGVDIDPRALEVSAENAARNGVGERLALFPPETLPVKAADVVFANILAGPLVALAPELTRRVRAQGGLVLAGLLSGQVAEVSAAYPAFTFEIRTREGWAMLAGRKRG